MAEELNKEVFNASQDSLGKKIIPTPPPAENIGIDVDQQLLNNIVNAGINGTLDIQSLEAFSNISQSRDQIYNLLDTMSQDSTVSAILETYAEDATEYNDQGRVMWAESEDSNVSKYTNYLLDSIGVDKHLYQWAYNLCKYGDIYLRLFRESEYEDDDIFKQHEDTTRTLTEDVLTSELDSTEGQDVLQEKVNIVTHKSNDHYAHYVEMMPNPAEMFELVRHGKTSGYLKAAVRYSASAQNQTTTSTNYLRHAFKRTDVDIHEATDFVHGYLSDNSSRTPEEVSIFLDDDSYASGKDGYVYQVKRGQSLLQNTFKIWRELSLLENSVLLNRITKSAIIRLISVEVGDMPKESVAAHLQGIKNLIEQKAAINANNSMSEYTNPGPVENNIYVPTHGGIGAIQSSQIGGDVDIKSLVDLDYFQDKFYGSMRVPKAYFGVTDDGAGFNGGTSLSIISSRYAKAVKRVQNALIQMVTDAVNLMLIDKGLTSYVNKFTIKMLPPTTQEEMDRRDNLANKIRVASDVMDTLKDIEDPVSRLKILKSLLSGIISDDNVIAEIDKVISSLEESNNNSTQDDVADDVPVDDMGNISDDSGTDFNPFDEIGDTDDDVEDTTSSTDVGGETSDNSGEEILTDIDNDLPSPMDLGQDFTKNI